MTAWTVTVTVDLPENLDEEPALVLTAAVLSGLGDAGLAPTRVVIEREK